MKKKWIIGILALASAVSQAAVFFDNFNRSNTIATNGVASEIGLGYVVTQRVSVDRVATARILNNQIQFNWGGTGSTSPTDLLLMQTNVVLQNSAAGDSFTVSAGILTHNVDATSLFYGLAFNIQDDGSFYAARIRTGTNAVLQIIRCDAGGTPTQVALVTNPLGNLVADSIYNLTISSTAPGEITYLLTGANLGSGLSNTVNDASLQLSGGYAGLYTTGPNVTPRFDSFGITTIPEPATIMMLLIGTGVAFVKRRYSRS